MTARKRPKSQRERFEELMRREWPFLTLNTTIGGEYVNWGVEGRWIAYRAGFAAGRRK